jgi:Mlc titration factor MtfA (ptsG expression regulator)
VLTFSPALVFALGGLVALLCLLGLPWWWHQRRLRLQRAPFPPAWRRYLWRWPLYRHLPPVLQQRLQKMVQVFVAEKPVIGCQGLQVTDEMRVLIAAQACLMVLQLHASAGTAPFPELRQVLLYPHPFVVQASHTQPGGVVSSGQEIRLGESWQHGQVVLSWPDVQAGLRENTAQNLVIHEFAHQLDQENGPANGAPLLQRGQSVATWAQVFQREYETLQWLVDAGESTLIDPYGASAPEEFFAVASETFFMQPQALAQQHPALFAQLARYYDLDPRAWA